MDPENRVAASVAPVILGTLAKSEARNFDQAQEQGPMSVRDDTEALFCIALNLKPVEATAVSMRSPSGFYFGGRSTRHRKER
jgi:hypothetical protein